MAVLLARLAEKERSERAAHEAATRKGLIGSGDRSDRIRTYNFPQGRMTDHRINLTLYKLQAILDGDLDDITAALQARRRQSSWRARERRAMTEGHEDLAALGSPLSFRYATRCGWEKVSAWTGAILPCC
jgi:hypothetical protein